MLNIGIRDKLRAMLGLSRGTAAVGLMWFVGALLSACAGDSVDSPAGEAGASGEPTGGTGGASSAGSNATGGTGPRGGSGSVGTGGSASGATGGSASAGGAGVGGTQPGAGGTGSGAVSGSAGDAGAPASVSCDDVHQEYAAELARIQECTAAAECGKELTGTSCGCTRNLVARLDADTSRFEELIRTSIDGEACVPLGSTCDCPNADGYTCNDGRCAWNYVNEPERTCSAASVGAICVVGSPGAGGEELVAGMPLRLQFLPLGCFSSSCTEVQPGGCTVQDLGDRLVVGSTLAVCEFTDGRACTADCGGPKPFTCESSRILSEGTHTVAWRGDMDLKLTFDVPSTIPEGGLCASLQLPPD